ncbi:NADP-dependent oxidoreductase [Citricoccus sp. NPDC079358]|uniref:NADPH:quinone reductase-like Zn-dependent oxidoreductase n=2 Tax=Citricoccus TaxID=169133 RepID=A0A3D9L7U4_9MICC|nr:MULTISPECIES: NADP-dependent oxidoreductase [Citricoccus]REE02421.1 NADPH:quinone reductase-like Zn-dependent oxidoreductase [Citricoccus muralis]WMY77527.1 NADP-dependent oxidoreductase [Citricoccus sp. I39-566]
MSKVLVFTDYGGPEHQELIEREVPEPGPGEIVIQVMAAGVNPADAKMRQGLFGTKRTLPSPMGLEASGIVTAVGEGVEAFAVGNEVLGSPAKGQGTFAEHAVLNAAKTVAKPEEISFVDAAAIPVAGTAAYDVTHQVELEPGQSLLILGAGGGVGLMAAQIGTVHQYRVIGVASASKRELVESTGATFVESGDGAADRVREVAPEGVDLVVDLVGGQALRDIAPVAKDPKNVITTADPATAEELGGAGVKRTQEALEKITGVIQYGLVDPNVGQRFSLADAQEAMAAVEGGHTAGKVVIEP